MLPLNAMGMLEVWSGTCGYVCVLKPCCHWGHTGLSSLCCHPGPWRHLQQGLMFMGRHTMEAIVKLVLPIASLVSERATSLPQENWPQQHEHWKAGPDLYLIGAVLVEDKTEKLRYHPGLWVVPPQYLPIYDLLEHVQGLGASSGVPGLQNLHD